MHLVYTPPPPPPQENYLTIYCFQFLLGITVVPREIEDNDKARRTSEANLLVVKDLILILKGLCHSIAIC